MQTSLDNRSAFGRDRDRIVSSSAYRRLAGITQVVSAHEGHVFHNRLTHTLKVAQVARRLAEHLQDAACAAIPSCLAVRSVVASQRY